MKARLLLSAQGQNIIFVGTPHNIEFLSKALIGTRVEKITKENGVRGHRLSYAIFDEAKIK